MIGNAELVYMYIDITINIDMRVRMRMCRTSSTTQSSWYKFCARTRAWTSNLSELSSYSAKLTRWPSPAVRFLFYLYFFIFVLHGHPAHFPALPQSWHGHPQYILVFFLNIYISLSICICTQTLSITHTHARAHTNTHTHTYTHTISCKPATGSGLEAGAKRASVAYVCIMSVLCVLIVICR